MLIVAGLVGDGLEDPPVSGASVASSFLASLSGTSAPSRRGPANCPIRRSAGWYGRAYVREMTASFSLPGAYWPSAKTRSRAQRMKGLCTDRAGGLCCRLIGMDPHIAEVAAEAWFEEASRTAI